MVKTQKKKTQQFFKIYVPDQSSNRLKIPPQFIKCLSRDLPRNSTIRCSLQSSWKVDLENVNENVYFREGWKQFVNDNSLQFGDFLVFYYDGRASFYVKIFGQDGLRKNVEFPSMNNDTTLVVFTQNTTHRQRKSIELIREVVPEEDSEGSLSWEIQEEEGDFESASTFMSRFPFFKAVVRYPHRALMHIPSCFVKNYMGSSRTGRLVFSDRSWTVRLSRCRKNVASLTSGWLQFSRDNKLRAGDICVFELIDKGNNVLRVWIFRCKE